MTVSTVVDHNDYTGNGVTTSFPYTFRIFKKTDLTVSVIDLSENITVLVLDTDYTVTNAGGYNGGSVVLTTPLANGWQISIARELDPTQETDLRNQGKFFAEVHEDAFDKLTMLIQQVGSMFRLALRKPTSIANWYDALNNYIRNLKDPRDPQDAATKNYTDNLVGSNFNRTLRVPESYIPQLPPANLRANMIQGFDSAGNPVMLVPQSGSAADVLLQLASTDPGKGDALIAVKQPYTNSVARTQHLRNADCISVKDFGAVGDGVTDDSEAINNALLQGKCITLPTGTYLVNSTILMQSDSHLVSHGAVLQAARADMTIIAAWDKDNWSVTGRLTLKGTGKAQGWAQGFKIANGSMFLVEDVLAIDIAGWGFLQEGGTYKEPRGDKGVFSNCMAKNCWIGREDRPNTVSSNLVNEYCTWIGFHATGCQIGNVTSAGNNSFIGGKLVDNFDGLWLSGGNNSTHGTMTGVQINHNSNYNINIDRTTAGFLFSGCTIFGDSPTVGVIRIVNSRGIQIVGCLMESSVYCDGAESNVLIQGCYNNGNFPLNFAGFNAENIYKVNNMTLGGPAAWNDQGFDYVNVFKNAVVNLTANTQTKVVFDSLQNYNLRRKYNLGTGIYTAPNRGVYRVMGSVKVGGTVTAAYLTIKRNGVDAAYAGSTTVGGFAIMTFNVDLDLNPGDTVEIFVTASGSSLTIAANPGCNMSIQGLW